jgi:hypothetical protein
MNLDLYAPLKEQFGNTMLGSALTASVIQHKQNKQAALQAQQNQQAAETDATLAKASKDMAASQNAYERQV